MRAATCAAPFARLADYLDGKLAASDQAGLEQHLAHCASCAAHVAWLRLVTGIMRADHSLEAPQATIQRAIALKQRLRPQPGLLERLVAALVYDSRSQLGLAGVRQSPTSSYQLLYRAGELDIDLQLFPRASGHWDVLGQALPAPAGLKVELWQGDSTLASAPASNYGEFRFPSLVPGQYRLALYTGQQQVDITDLVV
ncbi:MAG: zf-HC2 domain-containing protein [Deinococcus sp.]|nr:zf-HC2 domain-containing protein [Deinococcus sp.]